MLPLLVKEQDALLLPLMVFQYHRLKNKLHGDIFQFQPSDIDLIHDQRLLDLINHLEVQVEKQLRLADLILIE